VLISNLLPVLPFVVVWRVGRNVKTSGFHLKRIRHYRGFSDGYRVFQDAELDKMRGTGEEREDNVSPLLFSRLWHVLLTMTSGILGDENSCIGSEIDHHKILLMRN
jgi:hypothetical protein